MFLCERANDLVRSQQSLGMLIGDRDNDRLADRFSTTYLAIAPAEISPLAEYSSPARLRAFHAFAPEQVFCNWLMCTFGSGSFASGIGIRRTSGIGPCSIY